MIVALLVFSLVLQGALSLNIPRAPSRPVLPNSFSFNVSIYMHAALPPRAAKRLSIYFLNLQHYHYSWIVTYRQLLSSMEDLQKVLSFVQKLSYNTDNYVVSCMHSVFTCSKLVALFLCSLVWNEFWNWKFIPKNWATNYLLRRFWCCVSIWHWNRTNVQHYEVIAMLIKVLYNYVAIN